MIILDLFHISGRLAGAVSPVYLEICSSSRLIISLAMRCCCSTRPVVGAIRRILPFPKLRYSAIIIHSTAVLPNPVGITIRLDDVNALLSERI